MMKARGVCGRHYYHHYRRIYFRKRRRANQKKDCSKRGCGALRNSTSLYCYKHSQAQSLVGFLKKAYNSAFYRVTGKKRGQGLTYYRGLSIMPREEWVTVFQQDSRLLKLFRDWARSGCLYNLRPVPDRVNPEIGYVVSNIEWVSFSENTCRANTQRRG